MNYTSFIEEVVKNNTFKYQIGYNNQMLSFREVIKLWVESSDFRSFFIAELQKCPFEAYFWEVKPVTNNNIAANFEFVLINSTILPQIVANKFDFLAHFNNEETVVSFANLNGDAQLIVPTDISNNKNYPHLAQFVRNAPIHQVEKLWQVVGQQYAALIHEQPKWLSTAGLGVSWLHIRIDSMPKYYKHKEYRLIT